MADQSIDFHALEPKDRLALSLGGTTPFFVTGEDSIEIAAMANTANVVVTLAGRFRQLTGEVSPFIHSVITTNDRTIQTALRSLGDGWILDCMAYASSGGPAYGAVWARVRVLRGGGGATTILGTIASGYVTTRQAIAFPAGFLRGSLDGPGALRSVAGTNPVAGAECSDAVGAGARWRLMGWTVSLVTDATPANRFPTLIVDDGLNVVYQTNATSAIAASLTTQISAGPGSQRLVLDRTQTSMNLPVDIYLDAGWRLRTSTEGLQAGDNYGAPRIWVEEWIAGE